MHRRPLVRAAEFRKLAKEARKYAVKAISPSEKRKWLAVAQFLSNLAGQSEADATSDTKTNGHARPNPTKGHQPN
jgi:hypothetical protein